MSAENAVNAVVVLSNVSMHFCHILLIILALVIWRLFVMIAFQFWKKKTLFVFNN